VSGLRFVVLRHDGVNDPHFDLMFETAPGRSLETWRSPSWPIEHPTRVVKLADHRRAYLDFEGPVAGNRGTVARVASGTYHSQHSSAAHREFHFAPNDRLLIRKLTDPSGTEYWEAVPI